MTSKKRIRCTRCGKCCIVLDKTKNIWVHCRYLVHYRRNSLTYCRIYPNRIGVKVAPGVQCVPRNMLPYDIPGCPYNVGKPMHPAYINKEVTT